MTLQPNAPSFRRRSRRGQGGSKSSSRRRHGGPHKPVHITPEPPAIAYELETFDPAPIAFDRLNLDSRLLQGIKELGWSETRPVQSGVIPLAIAGHDVIASAETGTGKTAAFLIPILQRFLREGPTRKAATRALILAPTRELAVQIEDQVQGLTYHTAVSSIAVFGGVDMTKQEQALRAHVDIVVATPGRLMDHMRHESTAFGQLEVLVLDEADRMLDMGFWPDVQRILAALPDERQTLLFSATMPNEVVRDALEITRHAKYVQVGQRSAPPKSITHRVESVAGSHKVEWLIDHLRKPEGPVLVFMRTKIGAERLARKLSAAGIKCTSLHADRSQDQRRVAVEGFKSGRYKVLVATDIAARGLDIDAIHTVINYEVPESPDTYVHRVGRTGRAGEVGQAITLVSPEERYALGVLAKSVGVPLE